MLNNLPPWPSFSEQEAEAVSRVLLSNKVNYWTGTEAREFEKEFAEFSQSKYAIALANGTLALDLALVGLGVGPGDEVIVSPRSFIASVSCVVNAGATPVFADVCTESQNISPESILKVVTDRTKAIIVVHLAGMPAEMDPIMQLARERDIFVIEDCAQAHGAKYKGRSVGSIGDVGAWSFCQDKIMTTGGEGGMVTTNNHSLWITMWSFKDHGKSWEAVYEREHKPGFRWLHESIGTNWRMTELQAVIGRLQLEKMDEWNKLRTRNAGFLWDRLRKYKWLRVPDYSDDFVHAAYKAYVFVKPDQLPAEWSRDRVLKELETLGVPVFVGSCPEIYLELAFSNCNSVPRERLPAAKELGENSLMFQVHPGIETDHLMAVCDEVENINMMIQSDRISA